MRRPASPSNCSRSRSRAGRRSIGRESWSIVALAEAELPGWGAAADSVLSFSRAAGVPAAALLHAEAEESRRVANADGERRAAELGTRLLLPLGVCILPAFIALGVAPIVVSIVSSTAAAV